MIAVQEKDFVFETLWDLVSQSDRKLHRRVAVLEHKGDTYIGGTDGVVAVLFKRTGLDAHLPVGDYVMPGDWDAMPLGRNNAHVTSELSRNLVTLLTRYPLTECPFRYDDLFDWTTVTTVMGIDSLTCVATDAEFIIKPTEHFTHIFDRQRLLPALRAIDAIDGGDIAAFADTDGYLPVQFHGSRGIAVCAPLRPDKTPLAFSGRLRSED